MLSHRMLWVLKDPNPYPYGFKKTIQNKNTKRYMFFIIILTSIIIAALAIDTRLRGYDGCVDEFLFEKICGYYHNIIMKSGGYVYILASGPMGTLYIGSSSDLVGRIWQHKNKAIKGFTSKYNVDKLVYYEWHERLENMVARERQLKKWNRNWKYRLIIQKNPDWRDLYNDILLAEGYSPE